MGTPADDELEARRDELEGLRDGEDLGEVGERLTGDLGPNRLDKTKGDGDLECE